MHTHYSERREVSNFFTQSDQGYGEKIHKLDTINSEQVKLTYKNGQDRPNFQMAKDAKGASLQWYPT